MSTSNAPAAVRIVGIGGAGCHAVEYMLAQGFAGGEGVVMNTDMQALSVNRCPRKVPLALEPGFYEKPNIVLGRRCAQENRDAIAGALRGARLAVLIAGLGGSTGTGAIPLVAEIAGELGLRTVCLVTTPFSFEGRRRAQDAEQGLDALRKVANSVLVYPNERILEETPPKLTFKAAFEASDAALYRLVQAALNRQDEPDVNDLDSINEFDRKDNIWFR